MSFRFGFGAHRDTSIYKDEELLATVSHVHTLDFPVLFYLMGKQLGVDVYDPMPESPEPDDYSVACGIESRIRSISTLIDECGPFPVSDEDHNKYALATRFSTGTHNATYSFMFDHDHYDLFHESLIGTPRIIPVGIREPELMDMKQAYHTFVKEELEEMHSSHIPYILGELTKLK